MPRRTKAIIETELAAAREEIARLQRMIGEPRIAVENERDYLRDAYRRVRDQLDEYERDVGVPSESWGELREAYKGYIGADASREELLYEAVKMAEWREGLHDDIAEISELCEGREAVDVESALDAYDSEIEIDEELLGRELYRRGVATACQNPWEALRDYLGLH